MEGLGEERGGERESERGGGGGGDVEVGKENMLEK